jgi:hypothetical protein
MARYDRHGNKRRYSRSTEIGPFFVIGAFLLAVIIMSVVAISAPENSDPRKGSVYVGAGVAKVCDGTTLIYDGEGTQAIQNSPECQ